MSHVSKTFKILDHSASTSQHLNCTANSSCKVSAWLRKKVGLGKRLIVGSRISTTSVTKKNLSPRKTSYLAFPFCKTGQDHSQLKNNNKKTTGVDQRLVNFFSTKEWIVAFSQLCDLMVSVRTPQFFFFIFFFSVNVFLY